MPVRVVPGRRRPREGRSGEGARRDHDQVGLVWLRVEDLRPAVGAEVEDVLLAVGLVGAARVLPVAARDLDLTAPEPGLHAEGAAGAALACVAAADRDREWVARDPEAELA